MCRPACPGLPLHAAASPHSPVKPLPWYAPAACTPSAPQIPLQRGDSNPLDMLRASLLAAQPRRTPSSAALNMLAAPELKTASKRALVEKKGAAWARRAAQLLLEATGVQGQHLAVGLQLVAAYTPGARGVVCHGTRTGVPSRASSAQPPDSWHVHHCTGLPAPSCPTSTTTHAAPLPRRSAHHACHPLGERGIQPLPPLVPFCGHQRDRAQHGWVGGWAGGLVGGWWVGRCVSKWVGAVEGGAPARGGAHAPHQRVSDSALLLHCLAHLRSCAPPAHPAAAPPASPALPPGAAIFKGLQRFAGTLLAGGLGVGAQYTVFLLNGLNYQARVPREGGRSAACVCGGWVGGWGGGGWGGGGGGRQRPAPYCDSLRPCSLPLQLAHGRIRFRSPARPASSSLPSLDRWMWGKRRP